MCPIHIYSHVSKLSTHLTHPQFLAVLFDLRRLPLVWAMALTPLLRGHLSHGALFFVHHHSPAA